MRLGRGLGGSEARAEGGGDGLRYEDLDPGLGAVCWDGRRLNLRGAGCLGSGISAAPEL